MAFLRPDFLIPISFYYAGAVDNLTDVDLGRVHFDCKVFYIDWRVMDANNTFDTTTITLEWDDAGTGSDTEIDSFATGAGTGTVVTGNLTLDDLTSSAIPGGSRILLTASDASTGIDTGLFLTMWVYPINRP